MFIILIAPEPTGDIVDCVNMSTLVQNNVDSEFKNEINQAINDGNLKLPDGKYVGYAVRKAEFDRDPKDNLKDIDVKNGLVKSKEIIVKDGSATVK